MSRLLCMALLALLVVSCGEEPLDAPPEPPVTPDEPPQPVVCPSWDLTLGGQKIKGDWGSLQTMTTPNQLVFQVGDGLDEYGEPKGLFDPLVTVFEISRDDDGRVLVGVSVTLGGTQYQSAFEDVVVHWQPGEEAGSGSLSGRVRQVTGDQEVFGFGLEYRNYQSNYVNDERINAACL